MKFVTIAASAALALALAACGPQSNTAEKAGEAMDTQAEQAATGDTNLADGPMENAGEAVDAAKEDAASAAQDAATAEDQKH
jgi:hypothetical protein